MKQAICDRCKQGIKVKRICNNCKAQVGTHHKWFFKTEKDKTFIVHRNCGRPEEYNH